MALELDIKTSFGVCARYHRISKVTVDFDRGVTIAYLATYLTEEARRAGGTPLYTKPFIIHGFTGQDASSVYDAYKQAISVAFENKGENDIFDFEDMRDAIDV